MRKYNRLRKRDAGAPNLPVERTGAGVRQHPEPRASHSCEQATGSLERGTRPDEPPGLSGLR
jgi:hypothetical protein